MLSHGCFLLYSTVDVQLFLQPQCAPQSEEGTVPCVLRKLSLHQQCVLHRELGTLVTITAREWLSDTKGNLVYCDSTASPQSQGLIPIICGTAYLLTILKHCQMSTLLYLFYDTLWLAHMPTPLSSMYSHRTKMELSVILWKNHINYTHFPNFLCLIMLLVRVRGILPITIDMMMMMKAGKTYIQFMVGHGAHAQVCVHINTYVQMCMRYRIIYIIKILYITQILKFSTWYTSLVSTHSTLFNKELTAIPKYAEVTSHEVPPRNDAGTVSLH